MNNQIIHGNAETIAPTLPEQCVHTIVTSPPYYGLRDYGNTEQIGLEETPTAYINRLVGVFQSLRPCLRDDGTLWVNLGDSYAGSGKGGACYPDNAMKYKQGTNIMGTSKNISKVNTKAVCKPKDLIGIPWMFAFAMRDAGWYLRQDIIWAKKNCMPESVKDRCTKAHEYIFLFSKQQKYYYDYQAIQEKSIDGTSRKDKTPTERKRYPTDVINGVRNRNKEYQKANKRSVWHVETQPFKEAHFATFPPKLITPCILAGAPEQGVVLDPFIGAGTTALVALRNNRNFIGIELNAEYISIANKRIEHLLHQERISL